MSCDHVTIGGMHAIVCSRGVRWKRPKLCQHCTEISGFQCDWILARDKNRQPTKRCDMHLCGVHATEVAPDKHLCPLHQRAWEKRQATCKTNTYKEKRDGHG